MPANAGAQLDENEQYLWLMYETGVRAEIRDVPI